MKAEQRHEPRISIDQKVAVRPVSGSQTFSARIINVSNFGIGLLMDGRMTARSAVRVEWEDMRILGEMLYCQPHNGQFMAGIRVESTLLDNSAIAAAIDRWKARFQ